MSIQKRAVLLRIALLFLLGGAQSGAFGQQTRTIDHYRQHKTEVSTLGAEAQVQLQAFATALVGAALANESIEVTTIGHADFDAQGRGFEVAISRERAVSAENAVISLFEQMASTLRLPPDRIKLVRFLRVGAGTLRPIVNNPTREDQRLENRRVELAFSPAPAAPSDSGERFQSCVRALVGVVPPEPASRMSCVCDKLLRTPTVKDYFYDLRAAQQVRAAAGDVSQFTPGQLSDFYRSFMPAMGRRIAEIPAHSDLDLAAGLRVVDTDIVTGIKEFLKKSVEPGAGAFEHSVAFDIAHRLHDPNHTYSCYANLSLAE